MSNISIGELTLIADTGHTRCGDASAMAREILEYRKAGKDPVMYAMVGEYFNGEAVSTDKEVVDAWVEEWNEQGGNPDAHQYRNVPLYAAPQLQPVSNPYTLPAGWVMVPVTPNWEMLSADGCKEHHNGQECLHHDNRRRIWTAMLAAAPNP